MSFWKSFCVALLLGGGWSAVDVGSAVAAQPLSPLVWEPTNQIYKAKESDVSAKFTFSVRNPSSAQVVVDDVKTSCGCTVAQLPSKPWRLAPGETNHMDVLVDLRGKWGRLFKTVTVNSSTNVPTLLTLVIDVPQQTTNGMSKEMASRIWGQQLAALDHQAVFKKDCVQCHLVPAFGKTGENLFHVTCGICHEAQHRATMVPDLKALKTPIDDDYWRNWVTYGEPGTLMPGFAATIGGPLDNEQINSLVAYLQKAYPRPHNSASDNPGAGSK